jgi:hypothetical protein
MASVKEIIENPQIMDNFFCIDCRNTKGKKVKLVHFRANFFFCPLCGKSKYLTKELLEKHKDKIRNISYEMKLCPLCNAYALLTREVGKKSICEECYNNNLKTLRLVTNVFLHLQ